MNMIAVCLFDVNNSKEKTLPKIKKWLKNNTIGFYIIKTDTGLIESYDPDGSWVMEYKLFHIFEFELNEDAVAFKLQWVN